VKDVNEDLRDLLLRRQHYIHRYENGTIKEMYSHYNSAKENIMFSLSRLQAIQDMGPAYPGATHTLQFRIDKLQNQLHEITTVLNNSTINSVNELSYNLREFAFVEKDYYENLLDTKFGKIGINISRLPYEQFDTMLRHNLGGPTGAYNWQERFYNRYNETLNYMREQLVQSTILGEDMSRASRRLLGLGKELGGEVGERIQRQCTVIARTEIMRTSNLVHREVYQNNQDVIKGVEFLATLDDRTCIECGAQDGKVWDFKKDGYPVISESPPRHPLCRCILVPITYGWKELGDRVVKEVPETTRASFSGQVPAALNYSQWLKIQPDSFVKDILGPKRFKLWKEEGLELKDMVKGNRILRLDELDEISGLKIQGTVYPKSKVVVSKSSPMSSVGRFLNCVPKSIGEYFIEAVRPDPCVDYIRDNSGKWFFKGSEVVGDELDRLNKIGVPPAWNNVVVSSNPNAKIQVIGQDAAGRWQYKYSAKHVGNSSIDKFDRVRNFSKDMSAIRRGIDKGLNDGDPRAFLLELENRTAIRAGSYKDFKAKQKAYGLTTLQNEHLTIKGDKIILNFTAKEGIPVNYEVKDQMLASWLSSRKAATKVGDPLFKDIPADKLNGYIKELSGGKKYTIKDFRTYHGTRIAYEEIKKYAGQDLITKKKKKIVKEVSEKVSMFLKNTPTMAKNSYIDPMVWEFIGGL